MRPVASGRTSSDGPVILGAVRVGEREVIVQDASGREARAVARVEKGRRTSVSLALMKDAPASADGLRPLGRNPQGGEEFWRDKDGAIVVRIPGGEFQMGSAEAEGEPPERPRHAVRVDGFLLDKTEVTWGQYQRFLVGSSQPASKPPLWGIPEAALQFGVSILVWGVFVRTIFVWHVTWFVNSLTHLFGYRNYTTTDDSRNNCFGAGACAGVAGVFCAEAGAAGCSGGAAVVSLAPVFSAPATPIPKVTTARTTVSTVRTRANGTSQRVS